MLQRPAGSANECGVERLALLGHRDHCVALEDFQRVHVLRVRGAEIEIALLAEDYGRLTALGADGRRRSLRVERLVAQRHQRWHHALRRLPQRRQQRGWPFDCDHEGGHGRVAAGGKGTATGAAKISGWTAGKRAERQTGRQADRRRSQ